MPTADAAKPGERNSRRQAVLTSSNMAVLGAGGAGRPRNTGAAAWWIQSAAAPSRLSPGPAVPMHGRMTRPVGHGESVKASGGTARANPVYTIFGSSSSEPQNRCAEPLDDNALNAPSAPPALGPNAAATSTSARVNAGRICPACNLAAISWKCAHQRQEDTVGVAR